MLRVDGILVGQLDGLEIDSGMVGMTGWKSLGVSSAGCGSTANVAQDVQTKIASTQVMKRGDKEFNGCTIFGVEKSSVVAFQSPEIVMEVKELYRR